MIKYIWPFSCTHGSGKTILFGQRIKQLIRRDIQYVILTVLLTQRLISYNQPENISGVKSVLIILVIRLRENVLE